MLDNPDEVRFTKYNECVRCVLERFRFSLQRAQILWHPCLQRRRWLESLSPNDLESVRSYAWDRLLRARKVKVDGKQLSLKALHDLVTKQQEEFECGLYNDDQRTVSRLQAQNAVPSRYMRLGSYKQVLREEEEQSLGLQRMGHGNCLTSRKLLGALPLLPQRHFAYGICKYKMIVSQFAVSTC
jgi:hypothetical protein